MPTHRFSTTEVLEGKLKPGRLTTPLKTQERNNLLPEKSKEGKHTHMNKNKNTKAEISKHWSLIYQYYHFQSKKTQTKETNVERRSILLLEIQTYLKIKESYISELMSGIFLRKNT